MAEDARLEARTRRVDAVADRVVPYFGLALGTVITPVVFPTGARFWLVAGPLVAASAAWSWWFTRPDRRPPGPARRLPGAPAEDASPATRFGGLYIAGLLVLMAMLVHLSPFYGFQALAGYVHSVAYLRRFWPVAGVVGTAALASYAQLGGAWNPLSTAELGGLAALTVVNAAVGGGFTYLGYLTTQQSERRRQVIAELNEANRRLAESLAENAALHARLMEQAREAGVLDERARLAREIHDTIAQGLAGVVAQLEAAEAAEDDPPRRQRHGRPTRPRPVRRGVTAPSGPPAPARPGASRRHPGHMRIAASIMPSRAHGQMSRECRCLTVPCPTPLPLDGVGGSRPWPLPDWPAR
jgi:hypothetical protein